MKQKFKEFFDDYNIDLKALNDDTIVVLDTNILLHIFRFSDEYKTILIEAIKKIENRIYIPYIVGLEFNYNRKSVSREMMNKRKNFEEKINNGKETFIKLFKNEINNINIKSADEKEIRRDLIKQFDELINNNVNNFLQEEMNREFDLIKDSKDLTDELASLLDYKVGECPTQEEINEIEKDGIERYKINFPPGYEDGKGKQKNEKIRAHGSIKYSLIYGDLLVWKDILKKVNDSNNSIKNVVFVTDDQKEDWQYIIGGEKKGPRAELKKEMLLEGANLFMLDSTSFVKQTTDKDIEVELDSQIEPVLDLEDKSPSYPLRNNFYEYNILITQNKKFDNLIDIETVDILLKSIREETFGNFFVHGLIDQSNEEHNQYIAIISTSMKESKLRNYVIAKMPGSNCSVSIL